MVGGARLLPILAAQVCPAWGRCFRTSLGRVAVEWPLGVRVVMAGYEYVSSEQLAGFDKYKVARALRIPLFLLVLASPRWLRSWHGPCHLVPRGSGQAGGRFSGGPAESWVFGVGVRESTLASPFTTGYPPGDRPFLRRLLDESIARKLPSLLNFIIIIIF